MTGDDDQTDPGDPSRGLSLYRLVRRLAIAVFGASLLAAGLAMIVLPGPAFILIPGALAVLALEFEWARRLLRKIRAGLARGDGEPRPPA